MIHRVTGNRMRVPVLPVLITSVVIFCGLLFGQEKSGNQSTIDNRIWSIKYWNDLAEKGLVQRNPVVVVPEALEAMQDNLSPMAIGDNNPDVAVTSASNTTQSENSIFVNPLDNTKVLNSNNSTNNPVTTVYGTSGFMSANGGSSWSGSVQGTGGGNSGDPAAVINLNGRYFVGYIAANSGQGVAYSDNEGASWTHVQVAPNPGSLADKNHLWIDNSPSSPYEGNLYAAWTDFGGPFSNHVVVSRSTNNGLSWSTRVDISAGLPGFHQGVNVTTGPNGEVYAIYTVYTSGGVQDEPAYGITVSTNGGASWGTPQYIITNTRGIRVTTTGKNHRMNSFPVAATDISGGPNNGRIYMVWTNIGVPGVNSGSDADVYIVSSDNNGSSWSSPVRVNQDPSGQGNKHYFPWITCDPVTGDLSVIYYDDRNVSSSQCQVFVAVSQDGGSNWTDFQVSDVTFTPSPIPGLASGYFGDYLGISARGGKVYPVWTDNRTGAALTYVSPFDITGGGNIPPTAEANGPYSAETGQTINFSSAGSNDPDGSIVSYLWNFGDGNTSSAANPSYSYSAAGSYNVTLTVTDDGGLTDVDNATATITLPGGNYATPPYSTGFESGTVDQFWSLFQGTQGRVLVTTANSPRSGSYHLTMDDAVNGSSFSQNEAWLRLNLSGQSQVDLDFWWKDFSDENHTQDGVFFSDNDGASFVKVLSLNGQSYTNNVWNNFTLDIDQLAVANGLSLSSTFVIKFQQYDNYGIATDGHAWDDISVTTGAANQPPVADANGPYSGDTGAAVSFSSAGSNDPDGSIVSYLWNFGDGNTSSAANPSHSYNTAGSYNVSLTVTDNGGLTDVDNTTATISDPPVGNYATVPYTTGFESGSFDQFWSTSSTSNGRVRILSSNGPHSGTYHMTMDDPTNGGFVTNRADLAMNLSAESDVNLNFWWKEFGDETHSQDGVYFSDDDGSSFTKVFDLNGSSYTNNTWQEFNLDVDALASAAGLSLSSTFIIRFQQYDNYPIATDGHAYDDIAVTAGGGGPTYITAESEGNGGPSTADGPVGAGVDVSGTISSSGDDDWFFFDVAQSGNINISVAIAGSADLDWYLYEASNTSSWVARGYTLNNPESGSYNASAGSYYVRVDGYQGATASYTLTITGGLAIFTNNGPEKDDAALIPDEFALAQNYPNPFNPSTSIQISLPEQSQVTVSIYNISGQLVRTLLNEEREAGVYQLNWDATNENGARVASGIYFYRMTSGAFTATRRLILMK